MEFAYSPEQRELRERAAALAADIMVHEQACEEDNGLAPEVHAAVADRVRHHRLEAINMPAEWGGQGLSVLDQEQLGRLTNALWDMVASLSIRNIVGARSGSTFASTIM